MKIDQSKLKSGCQFLIKRGLGENGVAIYLGQMIKGRFDFDTCFNGMRIGHMCLKPEDLETNPFQLEPIDESHPAFIKGVDVSGIEAMQELFAQMQKDEEAGKNPVHALAGFMKKKGMKLR